MGIEGVGLVWTGVGIARTGKAHGFMFGRRVVDWVKARWRRVERIWRALFHRAKGSNVVVSPASIGSAEMFGTGEVKLGYPPLDSTLDTASAIAKLDQRTRGLATRQLEIFSITNEHLDSTDRALSAVTADVQRIEARVDQLKDELPVEGLGTEALGLSIVGVGLIVQLVATVWPSLP
jgi:hypothetical protein